MNITDEQWFIIQKRRQEQMEKEWQPEPLYIPFAEPMPEELETEEEEEVPSVIIIQM